MTAASDRPAPSPEGTASRAEAADPAGTDGGVARVRPAGRAALSAHTRDRIAAQLRTMYDAVAQQPVPDRFADLIARLDARSDER